jgi:hypothetical protein
MKSKRFGICISNMMFTNEPTQRNPSWHLIVAASLTDFIAVDQIRLASARPTLNRDDIG